MPLGLLRFTNASGGTGDFVYPGPSIDMQSPATALAVDGQLYKIYAQSLDMTEWEEVTGNYTASSGTFARTTVAANSLGTTAKINFTNPPQVIVFDSGQSLAANLAGAGLVTTAQIAAWPGFVAGNLPFPAVQVPSANANTLDDYKEGVWTPVLTFATPGNLSVTYSTITKGTYVKIGRLVSVQFAIVTSTFTWTTASGNMLINGLPFPAVNDVNYRAYAPSVFGGINKAGYTTVICALVGNTSQLLALACGMGAVVDNVLAANAASGNQIILGGTMSYVSDN